MSKKYSDDVEKQIVNLYNNRKPIKEIKKEYDIHASVVYNEIRRFNNSGEFTAVANRPPAEKELIRLQEENKRLEIKNDILKQAALIMGRK